MPVKYNLVLHFFTIYWIYCKLCLIYYDLVLCLLQINTWFSTIYLSFYYHLLLFHLLPFVSLPFITIYYEPPKQSGGWGLVSTQFWRSKKNSNSKQFIELYFGVSEQIKPLQPIGQAAEFKFESKFEPLQVIWQSLPKAIPEDNWGFWLQNQWPSIRGRAPAQLGLVGRASVNTGRFQVGGSRWQGLDS